MPHVSGERTAADTVSRVQAHAGIGQREQRQHRQTRRTGPNPVCSRSLIEIDSRRLRVAARAYSEFGDCRNARIILDGLLDPLAAPG